MPTQINLIMSLVKETKGTHVYAETENEKQVDAAWAKVPTLYVKKTAFERGVPAPKVLHLAITY